ncbi:MAG TPA: hypothetical protein PKA59_00345 [Chakrabartia sp.]|jgi:hypothetical protein|nr:hypothetical protein [Chakrabartia sp.]
MSVVVRLAGFASAVLAGTAALADEPRVASMIIAQVQIEQRTVVRIRPVAIQPESARPALRQRWEEKKGPNCIRMTNVAGAMVSSPDSIDLVLRGGSRMRAKLSRACPSIDFYSGFYVKPSKDGNICEERDMIHSRSGGECGIQRFKSLVPGK